MSKVHLVTGGARSGKSRYALELAGRYWRKAFIAAATPVDAEMAERITRHRQERDASFTTIEEPFDPGKALGSLQPDIDVAVVDCLTVWLGNLMHRRAIGVEGCAEVDRFLAALKDPPCDVIVVTNEVGMGIVPENEMARAFRDHAGRLNARVAGIADRVTLMVSGIPLPLKGDA